MELPRETIGPYRLLRLIGRGGIGDVFAAVHDPMGREVALKVISQESAEDPQMMARFLQEARTLEQLRHPGIVRVYDCGKLEDGTAFLAMEHLRGETLRAWMRARSGPAPLDTALVITRQIAEAMVEVHAQGIVHRDLKPENVVLRPVEAAPLGLQPTIIDFGIAKVPPPQDDGRGDTHVKTAAHNLLGTSAYMAPEQCKDASEVTDRADVYALGGILFELIAGRPPFESTEDVELLYHHVHSEPPHLHELVPAIPPALGAFVASMLAKDPAQRPSMSRCRDMLSRAWEHRAAECPFPGLQPFSEAQAELFFGREEEARELLARLEEMRDAPSRRWLHIEGPSGAGKSSFVQAGILPQLAARPAGEGRWILAVLRPSEDPSRALEALLERDHPPGACLLLVIDPLEELLSQGGAPLDRLDALLSTSLANPASPLRLLTTLRTDQARRIEQMPRMARLLDERASRHHLRPLPDEALTQVILGMAARAGLRLPRDLAERMVRDATGADNRLPLLGHALRSLWWSRSGIELTHRDYDQMGGVGGALARQATVLIEGLGEDGRERAKWLILNLVQVGRGGPDTRRSRPLGEVLAAAGGDRRAEEVLARLSGSTLSSSAEAQEPLRLVALSGDGAEPTRQRVDLVHDALLRQVPMIAAWIDAERALLERHADLETTASTWEQAGYPRTGLPSGTLLDHYRGKDGDRRHREEIMRMASERARRFVDSALGLERRRRRVRGAVMATLTITAAAIAISAMIARRESERAEANLKTFILTTSDIVSDADWQLGRLPYTVDVRRRMLERIDENLASLLDREQPRVRSALAWTRHRRSDLARLNETLAVAEGFLGDARGLIDQGLADDPSSRELRELLALNLSKRGKVALARGESEKALADFSASVAVLEEMGADGSPGYRRTLATSYAEQADAEVELGHPAAAVELYAKAVALLEENGETESGYDRALVASTLELIAGAARMSGDLRGAAAHIERARSIQEPLAQGRPGNMLYQLFLGRIYASLAALRSEERRGAEAARLHELAIDIGEALHRGDQTQKDYGLLLCQALRGAEVTAAALGDAGREGQWKERRCAVARRFVELDPEDRRFGRLRCP